MAFADDGTSTSWTCLTGSSGCHRMGDRISDDCRQSRGSRDWRVRGVLGHCNDGGNVREADRFSGVSSTDLSRIGQSARCLAVSSWPKRATTLDLE